MSQKKIVINNTGGIYQIINRDVEHGSSYDVPPALWFEASNNIALHSLISSGDMIVNDGFVNLPITVALQHIKSIDGVFFEHADITLLPIATENAPELVKLSNASIGFKMDIGDEIYGQSRIDNYTGGPLQVQLHMCVDNSVGDRWCKFEVSYILTNGRDDRSMNQTDGALPLGPLEAPITPYRIFEGIIEIPEEEVGNASYIFIGIKRVAATGKTEVSNSPIALRYCKRYYKKLES